MKNYLYNKMAIMLFTTIISYLLIVAPTAFGQEKKETSQPVVLPKKVLEVLNSKFPKVEIKKQTKEDENGKVVYDIEFMQEGVKFEADILEDGKIYNWEQEISIRELPPAVKKTVEEKYPKATLKESMVITEVREGKDYLEGYEIVLITVEKKEVEITVTPNGEILEESEDE
jgi:hypothetical protein